MLSYAACLWLVLFVCVLCLSVAVVLLLVVCFCVRLPVLYALLRRVCIVCLWLLCFVSRLPFVVVAGCVFNLSLVLIVCYVCLVCVWGSFLVLCVVHVLLFLGVSLLS